MSLLDAIQNWQYEALTRSSGQGITCAIQWLFWHFGWELPREIADISGFDGEFIFEKDWDILILLDGLRVDLLDEIIQSGNEYTWLGERSTIESVSGKSSGWMERTFTEAPANFLSNTIYVTANPHTLYLFENADITPDHFQRAEELWITEWDDEHGTVLPRAVTDRGISAAREDNPDRLILHYMQPHFPSVPDPIGSEIQIDNPSWDWSAWEQLKRGKISVERVWESYKANLKYVLEDVKLLLKNVDSETAVVSSDHGNAIGERGYFGHDDWPVSAIKTVPWCETTTSDSRTYEPTTDRPAEAESDAGQSVESRLAALGYK